MSYADNVIAEREHELDAEAVIWAYRLFLGRDPESEEIIADKLSRNETLDSLRREFLKSDEFKHKNSSILQGYSPAMAGDEPPMPIEKVTEHSQLMSLFAHIQTAWEYQGEEDPHYSVLSLDEYRKDNLSQSLKKFYSSGQGDLQRIQFYLDRSGIDYSNFSTALEYGCGLGRVTYWLATMFNQVHAYDISRPHLAGAEEHLKREGIENVAFHHLSKVADVSTLEKVDFIYSVIVLQHNPPPLIGIILREIVRALNTGGVALFQIPTYKFGYSFALNDYLDERMNKTDMEMHVLPQREVFRIIREEGGEILEVIEDLCAGNNYKSLSNTFLIKKAK